MRENKITIGLWTIEGYIDETVYKDGFEFTMIQNCNCYDGVHK